MIMIISKILIELIAFIFIISLLIKNYINTYIYICILRSHVSIFSMHIVAPRRRLSIPSDFFVP